MPGFEKFDNLDDNLKLVGDKPNFKLLYNGEPIRLQLPPFYVPFGLKQYDGKYGNVTCTLDLSLRGYDEDNNRINKFATWYRSLEASLFNNSMYNPDQFNTSLKHANPEYAPLFRIKTPIEDGMVQATIWKENKEEPEMVYGNLNGLFKTNTAIAIVTPNPYVLPNGMWGISWRLEELKLFGPKRLRGCLFSED